MPLATSISVNHDTIRVQKNGGYIYLTAMVQPSGACACVTWRSANNNIASVNPNTGYVFGIDVGTTTIYAETNDGSNLSASVSVTVWEPVLIQSISFTPSSRVFKKHEVAYLRPTILPEDATNKQLSWSTSDPNVATITEYGLVRCTGTVGTAQITATATDGSGQSATFTLQHYLTLQSIAVQPSVVFLTVGQNMQLQKSTYPTGVGCDCVVWHTSNSNVVAVNPYTGLIVATGEGRALITARSTVNTTLCGTSWVIVAPGIHVEILGIEHDRIAIKVGESRQLDYYTIPWEPSDPSVRIENSDPTVATVDTNGNVTGLKAGRTTITIRSNELFTIPGNQNNPSREEDLTVTCEVIVYDKPKVTIEPDEDYPGYNKVVFHYGNESSKTWHCIVDDLIRGTTNLPSNIYHDKMEKALGNFFIGDSNVDIHVYTTQELQLLYAIDPHGVEFYVHMLASQKPDESIIPTKDCFFQLFFGFPPHHYKRTLQGAFVDVTDQPLDAQTRSESEFLFGEHSLWDGCFGLQLAELLFDYFLVATSVSSFVLSALRATVVSVVEKTLVTVVKTIVTIEHALASIGSLYLTVISGTFDETLKENLERKLVYILQQIIDGTDIPMVDWIFGSIDLLQDIHELLNSRPMNLTFVSGQLAACGYNDNYQVFVKTNTGEEYAVEHFENILEGRFIELLEEET